jgi:hypothetical protein
VGGMFMATRRDVLKFGAAGAGYSLLAPKMRITKKKRKKKKNKKNKKKTK